MGGVRLKIRQAKERDVWHVHGEDGDVFLQPLYVSLKELGEVDNNAEEGDGYDVIPCLPVLGRQVEGIADAKKPLDGDGHSHEDCPAQADVGDGVDDEGEADGVGVTADLKWLEGVVDAANDNVNGVKARQSEQQPVKTILQFRFWQHKNREQVACNEWNFLFWLS